jgi:tetratricopeptide (TPR) repeat protein
MIVRDEEASLPRCLQSASDLFHEIIVVDTGSRDGTRAVAEGLGARVFEFPWQDDFSAARNESLRHATGNWVFWLDADEWLDETNRQRLRSLFTGLGNRPDGWVMKQLCLQRAALPGQPAEGDAIVEQVRLFPRRRDVAWEHRVYEQVAPSIRQIGGVLRFADVLVHHAGYADAPGYLRKMERNLRLAELEHRDKPHDPYVLYLLGMFHQMLGRAAQSVEFLRRAAGICPPSASYGAKLHALLTQGWQRQGRRSEALAACRQGQTSYPADAELRWLECTLAEELGDLEGAERGYRALIPLASDPRLRGWVRHRLALLCRRRRQFAEAETLWLTAVAEQPAFAVAWLELAELYLAAGRWEEVEKIARQTEGPLGRPEDAAVLRSRVFLFRKEYAAARRVLEEAIQQWPRALRLRQALSHVLLLEGRDPAAAEKALRDVLALDPGNAQARENLARLLAQKQAQA